MKFVTIAIAALLAVVAGQATPNAKGLRYQTDDENKNFWEDCGKTFKACTNNNPKWVLNAGSYVKNEYVPNKDYPSVKYMSAD